MPSSAVCTEHRSSFQNKMMSSGKKNIIAVVMQKKQSKYTYGNE